MLGLFHIGISLVCTKSGFKYSKSMCLNFVRVAIKRCIIEITHTLTKIKKDAERNRSDFSSSFSCFDCILRITNHLPKEVEHVCMNEIRVEVQEKISMYQHQRDHVQTAFNLKNRMFNPALIETEKRNNFICFFF